MKKSILFLSMLLPFCMISQNITSINPNQAMQGQTINLIISGNNMSFSGWSCWSNTGNLSDFRFSQWSGTNMLYGTPTNSGGQQLNGSLSVPAFQATGIYNLEVFDCLNAWWIQFPNSFEILAAAPASWDCVGNSCIDPGNGSGMYSSVAACNNACGVTPSWDCVGGTCFNPGNGSGMYSSVAACNTACGVTPSWDCVGGACIDPGTGNGMYASIVDCNFACNNVSIEEVDLTNFKIYPNPSSDVFSISFTSETKQDLKVRILNVIGEELLSDNLEQFIGEYTKQINLSDNAKGIYFLELETREGLINKKLILQ